MKIADLFVDLGVKGDGKAQEALKGVNLSLDSIKTNGLAAKAGVLGVLYGMQRLASNSAQTGADLMSFAASTGLSIDNLQRWQYAAKLANVTAEEMKSSIIGLQQSMLKMAQGQGAPSGYNIITGALKKSGTGFDDRRTGDTKYMMEKMREYAQLEKNVAFANDKLLSMGLSLEMIAAMRRGKMNESVLRSAPVYSSKEAESLDKVNAGYAKIGNQWEMGIGKINAKFGPGFVKELGSATKEVLGMVTAISKLADQLHVIGMIGAAFEGWGTIFSGISSVIDTMTGYAAAINKGADKSPEGRKKALQVEYNRWVDLNPNASLHEAGIRMKAMQAQMQQIDAARGGDTNITVHANVQDGKDLTDHIKKLHKKATNKAARKNTSINEVN